MRQLSYVAEDGEIWLDDLDSDRRWPVGWTAPGPGEQIVCNWPTWEQNGSRLAYFEYAVARDEIRRTAVVVAEAESSERVSLRLEAGRAPIYMCWSPNGSRLAVLVQDGTDLELLVLDPTGNAPPIAAAQGAPLYFAWLPDSSGLIANVGVQTLNAPRPRLLWVTLDGDQPQQRLLEAQPAAGFRAPSWSTALHGAVVAVERPVGVEIAVQTSPDAEAETIAETGNAPAFLWNSEGDKLAFASGGRQGNALASGIRLYRPADGSIQQLTDEPLIAFFWCPDGKRIVWLSGESDSRAVRLRIADTEGGPASELGWLRPSRDLFLLLGHFDQYAQSATLFSPAGDEIVLAASRAKELENGSVPTVRQILIRPLSDGRKETSPSRGRLAFWRPSGPGPWQSKDG